MRIGLGTGFTAVLLGLAIATAGVPTTEMATTEADRPHGDKAIEQAPLERFSDLSDPQKWKVHEPSGLHYRQATAEERAANGWRVGAFVVEMGSLSDARQGPSDLSMLFPLDEDTTSTIDLRRAKTKTIPSGASHAVANTTDGAPPGALPPTFSVRETEFYLYEATESSGVDGYLISSDDSGFSGKAVVDGQVGTVSTFQPHWMLDDLPAPTGDAPVADDVYVVEFVRDGENAETAGNPHFKIPTATGSGSDIDHSYAMFAEMKWCEDHESNWNDELSDIGWTVADGFSATKASMNYDFNHCWFGDASQCDTTGGCHHHWWGHMYPYNGCDGDVDCYASNAWSDVDHAREHSDFPLLEVVNVPHAGEFNDNICGGAYQSNAGPDKAGAGTSADWMDYSGCAPWVATHEVGHNFNAQHKRADSCTVMKQGESCRDNHFSDENRNKRVDPCAEDSNCPRTNKR